MLASLLLADAVEKAGPEDEERDSQGKWTKGSHGAHKLSTEQLESLKRIASELADEPEGKLAAQRLKEYEAQAAKDKPAQQVYFHTGYHAPSFIKSRTKDAIGPLGFRFHKSYRMGSSQFTHVFMHPDGREVSATVTKSRRRDDYFKPKHASRWTVRPKSLNDYTEEDYKNQDSTEHEFTSLPDLVRYLDPSRIGQ